MGLEVHSSLSRMGQVEGGAVAVVEALLRVIGPAGAVVMSAYPVSLPLPVSAEERRRGISWKIRRFAEDAPERSGMGAIADAFRDRKDVVLGTGLHRVCAWGKDAAEHARVGYQHLADIGGWALLIGVGIDRCSSMLT
jgi:aminoglycoside 3-N-acetyltransferase